MGYGVLGWKLMSKGSYMKLVILVLQALYTSSTLYIKNLGQQIHVYDFHKYESVAHKKN